MPQILHSGRDWSYDYSYIGSIFSEDDLSSYTNRLYGRFAERAKKWSETDNIEWICRHYSAIKMIMASTLMLNSLRFSEEKNLRITTPYLSYYSILSCCKSLIRTTPEGNWDIENKKDLHHEGIINATEQVLRKLNIAYATECGFRLREARELRELFSYDFPSDGLSSYSKVAYLNDSVLTSTCGTIAEIAQLNSECLDAALSKFTADFDFETNQLPDRMIMHKIGDNLNLDQEDYHRLGRLFVKDKRPHSLLTTARAGFVDAFFGAWTPDADASDDDDLFSPDEDLRIIFDFL